MKQLILTALLLLSLSASAQKVEVPGEVVETFQNKYRSDFMIYTWRTLEGNYLAHFSHEGNNKYASFSPKGKLMEEGIAFDKEALPEAVLAAIPTLDITAFIVDAYKAVRSDDKAGFLIIYETEKERHEFWVEETGKIIRQHTYPIPKLEEVKPAGVKSDEVDWEKEKW